jgi:hypothetical protein
VLDDLNIRQLVKTYYDLKTQLQSRTNADQLEDDIKTIWDRIYFEGAFLKGEGCCTNIDKCRVSPKRMKRSFYAGYNG